jgi:hypothetical protein
MTRISSILILTTVAVAASPYPLLVFGHSFISRIVTQMCSPATLFAYEIRCSTR